MQNSQEKSNTRPILSFMRKLNTPCRTCSCRRKSWCLKICLCALNSDRLALIRRMFSSVSCMDACRAPSASCIFLCCVFKGLRKASTTISPRIPPTMSRITKCQSIAIRIAEAPKKLTTMPSMLGRMLIMPFLITDMSEKTLFTSSPLW